MTDIVNSHPHHQTGFSLLELLLVLFILGLMAASAVLMTEGLEDQSKYDETKRRMEMIKRAIVGDSTRTVNGGPEISGFAADIGRLPNCLAELVEVSGVAPYVSPCDGTTQIKAWGIDTASNIWSGWRGPYIDVLPEFTDGVSRFRDGYANSGDDKNYGWGFTGGTELSLASSGVNADDPADDLVASDLVVQDDWAVELGASAVHVTVINQTGAEFNSPGSNLKLQLYFPATVSGVDGSVSSVASIPFDGSDLDGISSVPPNNEKSFWVGFSAGTKIPAGVRGIILLCGNDNLYDGDSCSSASAVPEDVKAYTTPPRASLPLMLRWIVE